MEENRAIRRAYKEAVKKFVKALRLEASLFNLQLFFDEHLEVSKNTEHDEVFITVSVWLTTFLLLLDENKREWQEIVDQLQLIGDIESIEQWLEARETLLEPSYWNNFLGQE